ncbi:hypothetical protein SAMN03097699_0793 [Flavobacteriaceae bacterium MAR_2010_188]|nr:hypothetical protein SAMN03097699_0793 [Flavobacteriaceae bacterium MAR_2010_188]
MKTTSYTCVLCISLLFMNCKTDSHKDTDTQSSEIMIKESAIKNLPDSEAGEVIRKAINQMGGMENWESKKTLSYNKIIKFFDSTGTQLREVKQLHEYQLQPELKIKITWEEDGDSYESINNGTQAWKFKNGEQMTSEEDKNGAWNSTFGSHYVATMPFKLTDQGAQFQYIGLDTLAKGEIVHNVKTTYAKGAGSAAGFHTWWYYFDKDTYQPVANFLDFGDGFSYIHNESFTEVDGIKLPHKRKSYRTNEARELLYITTDYSYEDYEFDKVFDEGYFEDDNL